MLEQVLKQAIPNPLSIFAKLTDGHDPYYFDSWKKEGDICILRYSFWNREKSKKNKKRVFINEVRELLKYLIQTERMTREDFRKYCPRTLSDGPCGFAVIIRILEYLQVIEVTDGEYKVKSAEKIQELLSN